MTADDREQARVFKALGDERRLQILRLLATGEKCACVLIDALDMPQSTLSYHMKILCGSGLVTGREQGKWTHYKLDQEAFARAAATLRALTAPDGE